MNGRDRISIPYFLNPRRDAVIAPIPAIANGRPVYRPFDFREFIDARGADNYADVGTDDAQIANYKISA